MKDKIKGIYQSLFKNSDTNSSENNFTEISDKQNPDINVRGQEPSFLGLKRKYVYYVGVFILLITFIAIVNGLDRDSAKKAEREAKKQNAISTSEAVQGTHLSNIPKDYTEQAKLDEKNRKEAERKRLQEEEAKRRAEQRQAQRAERQVAPNRPAVPQQPSYTRPTAPQISPEEKARLAREEMRLKAMASPIGFDIKEK